MYLNNETEDYSMLNISFNQDNSCFSIGTETGYKIYQTYPFKGPYKRNMNGGIGTVEMLYKSNFLALLGGGKTPKFNNNKVVIWDDNQNKEIGEMKFITPIINIKIKKDLLFIICQKRIYLFNFNTYDIIDTIDTGDNNTGLIAINNDPSFTLIGYPSTNNLNEVQLKNFKTKKNLSIIAQDDNVSHISMNYDGTLLATSNEKRTIVKVHSCIDGTLLKIFKRGIDKVEYIYICFDKETKFMAVSSNKGTIHIFSLGSTIKKLKEKEKMRTSLIENEKEGKNEIKKENKINYNIINIFNFKKNNEENSEIDNEEKLPDNAKIFFGLSQIEKGFAKVKIKPQKNICTFYNNLLIVISYDNKYYQAEIDMKKGGNCKLIQEINLNEIPNS